NETNNVAVYGSQVVLPSVTGLQPDLTLADLQIPTTSVAAGAILSYNFDASNAGTAAVPGNFTIKGYISTDQTLSTNDVQDGNINTGNYAAGFSVQNVPGASTIPASLAAGQYYLIVKIDGDNAIAEGNENNNTVVKPFTVTAPTTGNCEQVLSQSPMVCAAPLANGNFEVGAGAELYYTPYKRYEYAPNGNLVANLSDSPFLSIPAFVTIIHNGNSIATLQTSPTGGTVTGITPLPASITSTLTNLVVCSQTGTSNYFLAGTRTSDNRVVVLLLSVSSNGTVTTISTFNTNAGGFANSIVATSWGGAILGRTDNQASTTSASGTLYAISATNTLLYGVPKDPGQFSFTQIPCGVDAFRVNSSRSGGGGGASFSFTYQEDYQFNQQSATLRRSRKSGQAISSPLPADQRTEHIFYNADGSKWVVTRRIQGAAPQYNVVGTDSLYYQKLSATDQVLLSQALDKTKFDALSSLQIYAVAEVQPGKLAFFGNKSGAAWYYNPFCNTPACNLSVTKTAAVCNNNGTPNNAGDDTFTFSFTPSGAAGQWVAFVPDANSNGTNTTYTGQNGETRTLTYSIGSVNQFLNGTVNIGFQDSQNVGCTASIAVAAPATCSNGGGTPDCNAITITPGVGKITIAGFSAPHVLIKVFKPNWTVAYECLDGQCANPTVVTGLGTGNHYVEVKLMNATWGEICKKTQTVGVTNIAQQDDDRQRLAFDKFYPNPTAYLTTMELYSPVAQQATLDFYDRTGRLVHTQKVELEQGQNLIEQLVFDWKSGTYNVIARGEETALPAYGRFLKVWEE
ncbi:MAG: hypothetical protein IT258_06270, partial [Saprospiraceae bacterium]|nr:hypothetical protein [Saprospiraceae bacterium]